MKRLLLLGVILVTWLLPPPAQGGLVIQTGNNPQPDENILFNEPGLIDAGNPVTGLTNVTGLIVSFESTEDLATPSGGQARVEAADGTLNWFAFTVPGGTFTSYIFNLVPRTIPGTVTEGLALITAFGDSGNSLAGNFALGPGSNFFTVYAFGGELLTRVEVQTDIALSDVRQNRVGGLGESQQVPEPVSLALLLGGIAALAAHKRRVV